MVNLWLPWLQEALFFVLFVLKPWLIFVRGHGNSERILAVSLVVKLLLKLLGLLLLKLTFKTRY